MENRQKQLAADCGRLISKKIAKLITPKDFYNKLIELHDKYGIKDFLEAAKEYERKNNYFQDEKNKDGDQEVPF